MQTRMSSRLLAGAALIAVLLTGAEAGANTEVVIAGAAPPAHFLVQKVYIPWTQEITRRTNGEVTFQWNHGETLFSFKQNPDAVRDGLAGMSEFGGFWLNTTAWPVMSVFGLPFLFESTVQANLTLLDAMEEIPALKEELKGFKILGAHNSDFNNVHMARGRKPPVKLADFKDMRLIPAGISSEVLPLLGAIPRDVAFADRYLTVQRGEVDGQLYATASMAANKVDEISDGHAILQMFSNPIPGIMNQAIYEGLSEEARKAIDDMILSWTRLTGCMVDNRRTVMLNALKARGDEIVVWSDADIKEVVDRIQPVFDKWTSDMDARGMDGKAILAQVREIAARHAGASDCTPDAWWPSDAFLPVN